MNYKTFYKYIILIVFSLSSIIAFSQNEVSTDMKCKTDSLLNAFNDAKQDTDKIKLLLKIGDIYRSNLFDSALYYYNKALITATNANNKNYISSISINIGNVYSYKGDYDKSIEYYLKSLKINEALSNKKGIAQCYNNIGNVQQSKGANDKAMECFLKSLKIKEELGDKYGIALNYNNIGNVYYSQNIYNKALEYYLKSLKINEEIGDKNGLARCYNNIGLVHTDNSKYKEAIEFYLKSLKIKEELGDKHGVSLIYSNIGTVYSLQCADEKAIEYYTKSLKIKEELGDKYGISGVLTNIATLYIKIKKYDEAVGYLLKGLVISKEIGALFLQSVNYEYLSKAYNNLHNYEKALEYHILFKQINDSIFNKEKNKQIIEMQTKYETEKKEKENELLVKKNEIQELQINEAAFRQRSIFFIFGITIILILIISYFLYNRAKLKQKADFEKRLAEQQKQRFRHVIEAQENERKIMAQDLHDSLGQLLATVRINVSELKEDIKSEDITLIWKNSMSLIDEAATEARNISHNIMPNSLIKYGLEPALKDLINKINITSKVNVLLNIEGVNERLNESIEIALYRIIQETLSNNLKHSEASEIKINLSNENNNISLEIDDNGKGFDTSKIAESKGIGWKNIYSRTELLNGKVTVDSEIGKGTKLNISFAA